MRTNTARKVAEQPSESPPASAAPKKRGLNFGAITTEAPKSTGASKYPVLPDELGVAGQLAKRIKQLNGDIETLTSEAKSKKSDLNTLALQWYWPHYANRGALESSVQVNLPVEDGKAPERVLVILPAKYTGKGVTSMGVDTFRGRVIALIGEKHFETLFSEAFEVSVEGEKIPVEKQQDFIDGLNDLCAKLNVTGAVTATPTLRHLDVFHEARHRLLTIEQNKALNDLYPMIPSVKTNGVKE